MKRGRHILFRLVLVLAFVPFLLTGLDLGPGLVAAALDPRGGVPLFRVLRSLLPFCLAFAVLCACAWISLRLWSAERWRSGLVLATGSCAVVWALAIVASRSR